MTLTIRQLEAARSLLFVPALEERFVAKAYQRGAGAIILDLEDSIAPSQKDAARAALPGAAQALRDSGVRCVVVRVNPGNVQDLDAATAAKADAVMLPKVNGLQDVADAAAAFSGALLLLIETPLAVMNAMALASHARVAGLVLGSEDLALALGVEPGAQSLMFAAQQVVMAARAAGKVPLGVPGSLASLSSEGFGESAALARNIGMAGAVCIHPNQVSQVNKAFAPDAQDLAQARRILAAFDAATAAGKGAVSLDGKMLDLPIVERARLLLEAAA